MFTRREMMKFAAGGVALVGVGCGDGGGRGRWGESGLPLVAATTTMVADLAKSLGVGMVEVAALMGPEVDPHLFKPGQRDVQLLRGAEVVMYGGLHLEGRMAEMLERMERHGGRVFAVSAGLREGSVIEADGAHDPHIWGDASMWADAAAYAVERLAGYFPARAEEMRARGKEAVAALRAVHERLKARAEEVPEGRRVLVTSHDAFRYFGRAYGFEVLSVQGIATVSEAALADMARISGVIRSRGIKAVFVESSVSPATIKRISEETGAVLGGELCSDALGAPGEMVEAGGRLVDKGTVGGMLEYNMDTIVRALR